MKKLFTLAFSMLGLVASAQQVNGDFNAEWVDCFPWEKGANSETAYGVTPQGWIVSNVPNTMVSSVASAIEEEGTEGFAVKLTNQSTLGQKIPAYISLGTTWATAETRLTTVRNADGGDFGGIKFSYKPDGIRMTYKRDQSNGTERASVIAYLWNGTWTQAEVPSNTAVGAFTYGTATKVTMTDRDRNILGMETALGGEVTKTDDAELIASLESYITEQQDEWATFEAYFDYKNPDFKITEVDDWGDPIEKDVKLNIIISANDYFADRNGIVGDNSLTIDNVELIYKSQLADLKFNGETIEGFDKDTYTYTIDDYYKVGSIEAIKDCVGGNCELKYNVATAILTITVKGDDWSEENPNQHIYIVQFKKDTADTYQIKNGGFEEWEEVSYNSAYGPTTGEEPLYWSSFLTGTGDLKYLAGANQVEHLTGTTRPGSEGNACVRIFARDVWIAKAQGNLTTGCINMGSISAADASGNYNYSNFEDPDMCHRFTGRPDAMRVWVKASVSLTAKASAILHTEGYYQDPFYNDDNRITAQLVAEATKTDIATSEDWQELTIPFVYNEEVTERPSYALVSFSTSSAPGEGAETDEMYIDDLEFIYNSQLADLKFNGETVEGFDKDTYTYIVEGEYSEGSIEAIKDCVGGNCTVAYDEENELLTITVKGDDWTEENLNQHVYTVQFKKPVQETVTTYVNPLVVTINGESTEPQETAIQLIQFGDENNYSFVLKNFALVTDGEPMYVGTIRLDNLTMEDGVIRTQQTINIEEGDLEDVSFWMGPMLGEVPVDMTANVKGTEPSDMTAVIDIDMSTSLGQIINVKFGNIGGTSISTTEQAGTPETFDVYTLSGVQVRHNATSLNGLQKGIYVVNGKKYIVR